MTGKTHFLAGANAAGWILLNSLPPHEVGFVILSGGISALLPDLDASNSILQQSSVQLGRRGPRLAIFRPFGILLHTIFGHRGFLHSLLALILVTGLVALFQAPLAFLLALAVGYGSHLLLDGLTPAGIPLFYPSRMKVRLPKYIRIRTGGPIDQLLFAVLSLTLLLLILRISPLSLS